MANGKKKVPATAPSKGKGAKAQSFTLQSLVGPAVVVGGLAIMLAISQPLWDPEGQLLELIGLRPRTQREGALPVSPYLQAKKLLADEQKKAGKGGKKWTLSGSWQSLWSAGGDAKPATGGATDVCPPGDKICEMNAKLPAFANKDGRPRAAEKECVDRHDQCKGFHRQGECDRNPGWMIVNCPASCQACHLRDPKVRRTYASPL